MRAWGNESEQNTQRHDRARKRKRQMDQDTPRDGPAYAKEKNAATTSNTTADGSQTSSIGS